MKKVTVYCGESVQGHCRHQLHPVMEVKAAKELIDSDKDEIAYSNHPDFVSAVKYIGKKQGVETEFFLNGVSLGNNIDPIFGDFNQSFDLINEWGDTED